MIDYRVYNLGKNIYFSDVESGNREIFKYRVWILIVVKKKIIAIDYFLNF